MTVTMTSARSTIKLPGLLRVGMNRAIQGQGLEPHSQRSFHLDLAIVHLDSEFCMSDARDGVGSMPLPQDVVYLLECATDCLQFDRSIRYETVKFI